MRLDRVRSLRSLLLRTSAGLLVVAGGEPAPAQQFPNQGTANYNWSVPYGSNYNYGFMRYGQGSFGSTPYGAVPQSQGNAGMPPAQYQVYGLGGAGVLPGANQNVQDPATQAMEMRFDVHNRTPRTVQAKERQLKKPLNRNQVLSSEGKVLWPSRAPGDGDLGKSRAAAEAAIQVAYKAFKASGKATVQQVVEAKERLYAYGHPALDKVSGQSRQVTQNLHHFLYSLERAIDSLGGV